MFSICSVDIQSIEVQMQLKNIICSMEKWRTAYQLIFSLSEIENEKVLIIIPYCATPIVLYCTDYII